jgi:Uma2 family endonuclease
MSGVLDERLSGTDRAESAALEEPRASRSGEPTTEILDLFPRQGEWTEASFLEAVGHTPRYEFAWGRVERLPMVTYKHHDIVEFLYLALRDHSRRAGKGRARSNSLRLRLPQGHYREPDVMLTARDRESETQEYPTHADLVMEVVSGSSSDRKRDLVEKREDYAAAGIPEYWIVDPAERTITVLVLEGTTYREAGVYSPGSKAASVSLAGFMVDVTACFAAGDGATIGEEPTK